MRITFLSSVAAALVAGCAAQFSALPADAPMQTMTLRWQRLVDESDETCPRCALTEQEVGRAFEHLKRSLAPAGVRVVLETERMDETAFLKAPLESNRIWIDGRSLEEWLGAQTAASPCCDACGSAQCRTVTVGDQTYEAIPAALIVRAGFLAAGEALRQGPPAPAPGSTMPILDAQ